MAPQGRFDASGGESNLLRGFVFMLVHIFTHMTLVTKIIWSQIGIRLNNRTHSKFDPARDNKAHNFLLFARELCEHGLLTTKRFLMLVNALSRLQTPITDQIMF